MKNKTPSLYSHILSILVFPFNSIITIPAIILFVESSFSAEHFFARLLGIPFITFGLWLFISTITLFHHTGKGTLAPWNQTTKMVARGPYQYTRNPMIISVLFIILGESILFLSEGVFIWAILFFLGNHLYFILREEPKLIQRFGKKYATYMKEVPRWIPKF